MSILRFHEIRKTSVTPNIQQERCWIAAGRCTISFGSAVIKFSSDQPFKRAIKQVCRASGRAGVSVVPLENQAAGRRVNR